MKNCLFEKTFKIWLLLSFFFIACTVPGGNAPTLSSSPADRAQNELKIHPFAEKLQKHSFATRSSGIEQYRLFHPKPNLGKDFIKPNNFSIQTSNTPGECLLTAGQGTASGTLIGTTYLTYSDASPNLSIYQGPINYDFNTFNINNIRVGSNSTAFAIEFSHSNGVSSAKVTTPFTPVIIPSKLKVGETYTVPLPANTYIKLPVGYTFLNEGTLTITVLADTLTATISGNSILYRYRNLYYNRYDYSSIYAWFYLATFSGNGTAPITTSPCAPIIDLGASPTLIKSNETSSISITPENPSLSWTLAITGPNGYSQNYTDSGNSSNEYFLDGTLPVGDYTVKAYYSDYPEYAATTNIRIQQDIQLQISENLINPIGGSQEAKSSIITVLPGDENKAWTMQIIAPDGTTHKEFTSQTGIFITNFGEPNLIDGIYQVYVAYDSFPDVIANGQIQVLNRPGINLVGVPSKIVQGSSNSASFTVTPQSKTLEWNFQVKAPNGTTVITKKGTNTQTYPLPTPLNLGVYQATAFYTQYPQMTESANIEVVQPTPTPTPTQKQTPEPPPPTQRPCPEGAICSNCPIAGCGTPKPPAPPVPPEEACPPLGICPAPEPTPCPPGIDCPDGPQPSACPPGAICTPRPSPTPKPGDNACPTGYVNLAGTDANGNVTGGQCDYCPQKFFLYDYKQKMCYLKVDFDVRHEQEAAGAPINPVTFSPRDINGIFDKVIFGVNGDTTTFPGINYVKWDMELKSLQNPNWTDGKAFLKNEGTQPILYDGWNKDQTCLIDGKYTSQFLPWPIVEGQSTPYKVLVQVPGFEEAVPVTVFMEKKKDTVPFQVDNTPPVVKNFQAAEETLATNPVTYRTQVSFGLVEPEVNSVFSGLPDKDQLQNGSLKIYVDDAPFYTSPAVDSDGFWITSLPLPSTELTLATLNNRNASVSFSLPDRLPGHTIEVEVSDLLGNTGRYLVYPQGGQ